MPDRLAASSAFSVRRLNNIMDRLKVKPPPIPNMIIHKNTIPDPPKRSSPKSPMMCLFSETLDKVYSLYGIKLF